MKVTSKVNSNHLSFMNKICIEALVETADALKSNLVQSQTMPKYTGQLQDRSTFVDSSKKNSGIVSVASDTPYARRLYFHPEYKFSQARNPKAGGMWFQPYIDGKKKDFAKKAFAKILRGKMK